MSGPFAHIEVTAQQSRFHSATLDFSGSTDVDLLDVTIVVGERELLSGARIRLQDGVKYGLIGRNGCGKSTLLHALSARLIPGIQPSLRIVLVSQVDLDGSASAHNADHSDWAVLKHVLYSHVERRELLEEKELLEKALEETDPKRSQELLNQVLLQRTQNELREMQLTAARRSGARGKKAREEEIEAEAAVEQVQQRLKQGQVQSDWAGQVSTMLSDVQLSLDLLEADSTEDKAKDILKGLGFKDEMINGSFGSLSGGWRSRCRLALSLLVQSDLLIMDEPSNFMDLGTIIWLQRHITSLPQTVIITSHDQAFLDAVSEETIALREQGLKCFTGPPSGMFVTERKERLSKVKQQAALDKKREHIESSIAEGQRAAKKSGDDNRLRMAKSRSKKLETRWGVETSAKGTRFKLNRDLVGYHLTSRADIEIQAEEQVVKLRLPPAAGIKVKGNLVSVEHVTVGYGKGKPILEDVTMSLGQGDRVAFIGRNGQGKSTMVKALVGDLKPRKGAVEKHPSLKVGYFDQHSVESASSNVKMTPLQAFLEKFETLANAPKESDARACLGRFGLGGRLASHTPVEMLSGGQRVRLALAILFYDPPNFLVMDEVTTHLDVSTIRALAKALRKWEGGLVLVTHDRFFCNAVMKHDTDHDEDDEASFSDEDDSDETTSAPGRVFLVRKGGLRLLSGGMKDYEGMIERRLSRKKD